MLTILDLSMKLIRYISIAAGRSRRSIFQISLKRSQTSSREIKISIPSLCFGIGICLLDRLYPYLLCRRVFLDVCVLTKVSVIHFSVDTNWESGVRSVYLLVCYRGVSLEGHNLFTIRFLHSIAPEEKRGRYHKSRLL